MIIWGNHSSTQFPDVRHAKVQHGGSWVSAGELIMDDVWVRSTFIETVQKRGATIINARKMSSAMSAAKAAADHMHDWLVSNFILFLNFKLFSIFQVVLNFKLIFVLKFLY